MQLIEQYAGNELARLGCQTSPGCQVRTDAELSDRPERVSTRIW